jgi:hypothetical protein
MNSSKHTVDVSQDCLSVCVERRPWTLEVVDIMPDNPVDVFQDDEPFMNGKSLTPSRSSGWQCYNHFFLRH